MSIADATIKVIKFVAVVDGFILALQLFPYGGYDGAPGVANISGWQAVMVAAFIISIGYLWFKYQEEIDDLKNQLEYQKSKNPDYKKR